MSSFYDLDLKKSKDLLALEFFVKQSGPMINREKYFQNWFIYPLKKYVTK